MDSVYDRETVACVRACMFVWLGCVCVCVFDDGSCACLCVYARVLVSLCTLSMRYMMMVEVHREGSQSIDVSMSR